MVRPAEQAAGDLLADIASILGCDLNEVERAIEAHKNLPFAGRYLSNEARLTDIRKMIGIYGTSANVVDAIHQLMRHKPPIALLNRSSVPAYRTVNA